jgi:hypothetical protein
MGTSEVMCGLKMAIVHMVTHKAAENIQASAWVGCVEPPEKLQEDDCKGEIVRDELLELIYVNLLRLQVLLQGCILQNRLSVCANGFAHPLSYRAPDLDVIFSIM